MTDQPSNRGFFCCNTSNPKKYTEAGFVTGPVKPTRFASAIHIESRGYIGIYTRLDDPDGVSRYTRMTGLPVPDKHSILFPGLDYEVRQ